MAKSEGIYLVDKLENIGKCAGIGANFAAACDFIAKGEFDSLRPGRNEIDGDKVFVNCDTAEYVLPKNRKAEFHKRYFDIHIPLDADEKIGLAALDESAPQTFDDAKDCGFAEQHVEWFTVKRGEFAVCSPCTCAHAPAVTTDVPKRARKLIVKVLA